MLPERFEHLPEGMLPMCYPADHNDGVFIPNWALWFVVQLEEYTQRGGDMQLAAALEDKVLGLFDYFKPFLNEDGLLEKLESWVFVEWSAANRFVQDVNYPSNMLYAARSRRRDECTTGLNCSKQRRKYGRRFSNNRLTASSLWITRSGRMAS